MKCNKKFGAKFFMVRDATFPDLYVFLKIFVSEVLQSLTNSPNLAECCPSFWSQGHKQTNSRIDSNFKRAALHILPLSISIKRSA